MKGISVLAGLGLVLTGGGGRAEPPATAQATVEVAPRNYVNLQVGASTSSRHPEICLQVSPLDILAVEACGTGSGFLHQDPDPEIAHFRALLSLASWKTPVGWIQPRVGLGFAELQVGEDTPGFDFQGTGPTGVETAGPEANLSVRSLFPLGAGFELIGELGLGLAWFPHAPELVAPHNAWQPSAALRLGIGF